MSDSRFFDWVDYSVFGLLLTSSVCIGIYFGFLSKRKQNTKLEYLLGSREIALLPISLSLAATQLSGVAMIGFPAEMYVFGTQLWAHQPMDLILGPIMAYWFVPVFYNLKETSMYEYLNRRFNASVRTLGSVLFILKMMFLLPVVIYGPALALAQVSGLSLAVIIPVTCIVCTFYTTLGGMKAVVWTDSLQLLIMTACMLLIFGIGTHAVGGFGRIIEVSRAGQRIDFFKSILLQYLWIIIIVNGVMFSGLIIYTAFADCDPVSTKLVQKPDQILPFFVMQVSSHIPALPGIFLSAIFSASLSTLSTGLNSMSAVIVEDFVQPFFKQPITEAKASLYMKTTSVILGFIMMASTFLAQNLSGLVQGANSLGGAVIGALMGVFSLGMFFPWANAHGALAGTVSALGLVCWMAFGSQMAIYDRRIVNPVKPVSIAGCDNRTLEHSYNLATKLQTLSNATATEPMDQAFYLYRISYNWYTLIGVLTVLTVGMLVSWITGFKKPQETDYQLFSPAIQRWLPRRGRRMGPEGSMAKKNEQSEALMPIPSPRTVVTKAN